MEARRSLRPNCAASKQQARNPREHIQRPVIDTETLFLDASTDSARGGPDGLRVDNNGNIYRPGPGGVWIIPPEGKQIGTIQNSRAREQRSLGRRRRQDALDYGRHLPVPDQTDQQND
jgi:hypothetical protein